MIPQDLSNCLVFERSFLDTLQRRIKELDREKVKQKQMYRYCTISLFFKFLPYVYNGKIIILLYDIV